MDVGGHLPKAFGLPNIQAARAQQSIKGISDEPTLLILGQMTGSRRNLVSCAEIQGTKNGDELMERARVWIIHKSVRGQIRRGHPCVEMDRMPPQICSDWPYTPYKSMKPWIWPKEKRQKSEEECFG